MKPKIYALLIGINDYKNKPLYGCINDIKEVEKFLEWYEPSAEHKSVKKLLNSDATRSNVINAFSHFENAKEGDICLFYYCGHGSYITAPEEFYTSTDRFHQTLVCWDSRLEGGRDLIDKELAFLIWKYTVAMGKNIQFIAITDSCHSGSASRTFDEKVLIERTLSPQYGTVAATDYYGFGVEVNGKKGYKTDTATGEPKYAVEKAPHIHIGSARNEQTAKENFFGSDARGLFTFSFVKVLNSSRGAISYSELIRRTELNIKSMVADQVPVLNVYELPSNTFSLPFLSREGELTTARNFVYYDRQRGWCIDAGALQGISKGDKVITKDKITTVITEVFAEESTIEPQPEFTDKAQRYSASVISFQAINFRFDESLSDVEKDLLLTAFRENVSPDIRIDLSVDADFYIRSSEKGMYITAKFEDKPLFKEFNVINVMDARTFLADVQAFSRHASLLRLHNPHTRLSADSYRVSVTSSTQPDNYDPQTFQPVNDLSKPVVLSYFIDNTNFFKPAVQIEVANNSNNELWFYPIALGFDYALDTIAFGSFSLSHGELTKLELNQAKPPVDIIKMYVDSKLRSLGYFEITQHIKFIISTKQLGQSVLDKYQQDGLDLARNTGGTRNLPRSVRGFGEEEGDYLEDWTTCMLTFKVTYPMPGKPLAPGVDVIDNNVKITAPAGFQATLAWRSAQNTDRSLHEMPPHLLAGNSVLQPLNTLQTRGDIPAANLLELYGFNDKTVITEANPLIVEFNNAEPNENICVLAYDATTQLYFSAGSMSSDGKVRIHTLPDESVSERSLGGSLKLYFYKVVLSKIGFTYEHPQIALIEVAPDLTVKPETNERTIKERIEADNVKNILLFTHGIIGDTADMVKAVRLAQTADGSPINNKIDVVLAFDYENLNTTLERTAADLKAALEKVGITGNDNKHLTIVAHSMGGLISRLLIENTANEKIVDRLILFGTPNEGTVLADVRDAFEVLITFAVNGASFLKPWMYGINLLGKLVKGTQVTFKQMDPITGIYTDLNKGKDPGIPYYIIGGDVRKISIDLTKERSLLAKIFNKSGKTAAYDLLDKLVFRASNDIAVGTTSILSIPGSAQWAIPPKSYTIACDHLNYFTNEESLKILGELF